MFINVSTVLSQHRNNLPWIRFPLKMLHCHYHNNHIVFPETENNPRHFEIQCLTLWVDILNSPSDFPLACAPYCLSAQTDPFAAGERTDYPSQQLITQAVRRGIRVKTGAIL